MIQQMLDLINEKIASLRNINSQLRFEADLCAKYKFETEKSIIYKTVNANIAYIQFLQELMNLSK